MVSVAFGVSFVLSLLANRDIKTAFLTGFITVTATSCGVVTVNRKQLTQQKLTLSALEYQIRQLEKLEEELNQSLAAIEEEEERTESNINHLQKELKQLYTQTDAQRRYKQQLSQDVAVLTEQNRKIEAEVQQRLASIHNLEQRREELDVAVRSLKVEKFSVEASLKSVQAEIQQLQEQIAEQQNQKKELDLDLSLLKRIKPQLETEVHDLRTQLQELETRKTKLDESLAALVAEKQTTEASLNLLQAQLREVQDQVVEQKNKPEQESSAPPQQTHQMGEEDEQQPEIIKDKWAEFEARLSPPELQVLQAIAQQDNPNAAIKKIAEENITMPELLIAAINEHALATIGDIIIEPESVFPVIAEADYLTNVHKMLKINEIN